MRYIRKISHFVMREVELFKFTQLKKAGRDTGEIVVTKISSGHLNERNELKKEDHKALHYENSSNYV